MTRNSPFAVEAADVWKSFRKTQALRGVDLTVSPGTVLGLLGPNGAGKTTIVRILATLLSPDRGRAEVGGYDVVRQPGRVRRLIGMAGQHAAVDEKITGRENLIMFGRLYHLSDGDARRRADELLEQFGLSEARDRVVKTYSGGMRRRLDIAASLIIAPAILFLDEPTTGLDPRSRNEVWESVRDLVRGGTTVLLTTQYLDEADQLANQIAVLNAGRVIASGTPAMLKSRIGGDRIEIVVAAPSLMATCAAVETVCGVTPQLSEVDRMISAATDSGPADLVILVQELARQGIELEDISLRRPTLDDVFMRLTEGRVSTDIAPAVGVA